MSKDGMDNKLVWKKEYGLVLFLNAIYIVIFYIIMIFNN